MDPRTTHRNIAGSAIGSDIATLQNHRTGILETRIATPSKIAERQHLRIIDQYSRRITLNQSFLPSLALGSPETKLAPPALFASGLGRFLGVLGIPAELGQSFGLLALSTFLLTTLDTGTRLGRYVLEELLSLKGKGALWISTVATLALPLVFSQITLHDQAGHPAPAWKIIWPVFGSTNQLLGGLALMVITLWLRRTGRPIWVTLVPTVFMVIATTVSLAQLSLQHGLSLVGVISSSLLLLAVILLVAAYRALAAPVRVRGR